MTGEETTIRRRLVRSETDELMLAACATDGAERATALYERLGDEQAWNAACAHELESHLAHKLMDCGMHVPNRWRSAHVRTATRIGAYMKLLDDIAAALFAEGIPVIALKNTGIARGIFPCLGCSPMGDLDILARPTDFQRAHQILSARGYRCDSRDRSGPDDPGAGGLEYEAEAEGVGNVWVELQWRSIAGRWIQPSQEPDPDEMFVRSTSIHGSHVRLLSPEDNLLQVCLHTAKHSYLRAPGLRLHTDVERIVRGTQVDWDLFLRTVQQLKVQTAVYFSLWLPMLLIGTPVPQEVLRQLEPPAWKRERIVRGLIRAGLFYPNAGRKFSRTGYLLFNLCLYDDLGVARKAIFPDQKTMQKRYGPANLFSLPVQHARRLADLCFRRTGI